MCKEMQLIRAGLDARGILWHDQSDHDSLPIERTKFELGGVSWSVIHGFSTYGGYTMVHADEGLLEVMTTAYNGGDPVGWLTADKVLAMVDEVLKGVTK